MKNENPILKEIYGYYTNRSNYLKESMNEEGYGLTVDNNMFVDLMDMVQTGTYDEVENGHFLIPIGNNSTFHYVNNGECYVDDERGNEYDVNIDDAKLNDLARALNNGYRMVSEGNGRNAFTKVEQDPDTKFIKFTKKDNVSPEEACDAAHQALLKAKSRRSGEGSNPSLKDRRNDPEYMDKVSDYWKDRRGNMAEPHGFGTSGTLSMFPPEDLEESANEGDEYIPSDVKPDISQDGLPKGLVKEGITIKNSNKMSKKVTKINEQQLVKMISDITKRCINESMGLDPEAGEDEYETEQEYFNGPDGNGMPLDDVNDEYEDWFPENPAEESFSDDTAGDEFNEYDELLESKEKENLQEKQEKLLTFITENWNNHANNLIK